MSRLRKWILGAVSLALFAVLAGVGGVALMLWRYTRDLPDYEALAHYEPPMVTRVLASDGRLLSEYAKEKRVFVPMSAIPDRVSKAFLAAEDQNFYTHPGVDFTSVLRAVVQNVANLGAGRRPVGASTITQQVAKNFLLTNEVSLERKVKEAVLAFRIETTLSKDQILELYLNEIYLGAGAYGVASAALNYFNKSLADLTLEEAAYLAALPKAPSTYHPINNAERAKTRRDWVIDRMVENQFVTAAEGTLAKSQPLTPRKRDAEETVRADYFAEEIRRQLLQRYGEDGLYRGGLYVRATLDPKLQDIADRVFRQGLMEYDRRHGWRGPAARLPNVADWRERLAALAPIPGAKPWRPAVVLKLEEREAEIGFADGAKGRIPMAELLWAREAKDDQGVGPVPRRPADVLKQGDVVLTEALADKPGLFALRQIPAVSGAMAALDPHTGRVLALVGGWSYEMSQFNRATQAQRQPGSSFKPYVYMAALDGGYNPSSIVLDAPFVIDQGPGQAKWKPSNYSDKFYGPTPLRVGIEQSRNLMTVRLAEAVGMEKVADYAERLGAVDRLPRVLSMALGAGETTVLRMTGAYAQIVNGGKKITPTLIDRIQDRRGKTIWKHDGRPCERCSSGALLAAAPPYPPDARERVLDPITAYQMTSMLEGVTIRGTAGFISALRRPLAGKTGTTNDYTDAWFVGFSPDLAVGVYLGFDQPRSLGRGETGGKNAAPIFKNFMAEALANKPPTPFRAPPGARLVRVNPDTGRLARPGDAKSILEVFKPGQEPASDEDEVERGTAPVSPTGGAAGVGGLY